MTTMTHGQTRTAMLNARVQTSSRRSWGYPKNTHPKWVFGQKSGPNRLSIIQSMVDPTREKLRVFSAQTGVPSRVVEEAQVHVAMETEDGGTIASISTWRLN